MKYAGDMPLGRTHQQDLRAHTYNPFERYPLGYCVLSPYCPSRPQSAATNNDLNRLFAVAFPIARKSTLSGLWVDIATGLADTGEGRLGIYKNLPGSWYPGKLVRDAGVVAITSAGLKIIDLSANPVVITEPDEYWVVVAVNSTTIKIYGVYATATKGRYTYSPAFIYHTIHAASVYGALPADYPGGAIDNEFFLSLGPRFSSMD